MVVPAVEGIDLFKVAGRTISGWVPSFKMGATSPVKQPFCCQFEERLLLWLDYHSQVAFYARGDIGPQFAATYRLPIPKVVVMREQADQPRSREEVAIPTTASIKCTFLGVVPIDSKPFAESGVSLVECPDCGRTWTLSPRGGVVRFKSHDKRKTATSHTAERWAMRETIWNVVGGENK